MWFLSEQEGEGVVFYVLFRLVSFPLREGVRLVSSFSFSIYKFLILSFRSK